MSKPWGFNHRNVTLGLICTVEPILKMGRGPSYTYAVWLSGINSLLAIPASPLCAVEGSDCKYSFTMDIEQA